MADIQPVRMDLFKTIVGVGWGGINLGVLSLRYSALPAGDDLDSTGTSLLAIRLDEPIGPGDSQTDFPQFVQQVNDTIAYPPNEAIWIINHPLEGILMPKRLELNAVLIMCTARLYKYLPEGDGHDYSIIANDPNRTLPGGGHVEGITSQYAVDKGLFDGDEGYVLTPDPQPAGLYWDMLEVDTHAHLAGADRREKELVISDGGNWSSTDVSSTMYRWSITYPPGAHVAGFGRTGGDINFLFNLTNIRKVMGEGDFTKAFPLIAENVKTTESIPWRFRAYLGVNPSGFAIDPLHGLITGNDAKLNYQTSGTLAVNALDGPQDLATFTLSVLGGAITATLA